MSGDPIMDTIDGLHGLLDDEEEKVRRLREAAASVFLAFHLQDPYRPMSIQLCEAIKALCVVTNSIESEE